jgi:hypothetical protein
MTVKRILFVGIACPLLAFGHARAQGTAAGPVAAPAASLRVFLDCPTCDFDYIRTTIPWVDYVRDPHQAQVHLLVTTLPTATGGTAYTIAFLGRDAFQGQADTLHWTAGPTATPDEIRRGVTHLLQLGLVRYAAGSAVGPTLTVVYQPPDSADALPGGRPLLDPWHHWFFSTGVTGLFTGQQEQSTSLLSSSVSADRTTPTLKVDLGVSQSYNQSTYTLPDSQGGSFTTIQRNYGVSAQVMHSAGAHWSVGEHLGVSTNTFLNERLALRLDPAVEYDVFPYAEATRRQLVFQASVGLVHLAFQDTTIDKQLAFTQGDLCTGVSWTETQPWGSTNVALTTLGYLSTLSREDVSLSPQLNLRLAQGVSLTLTASLGLTRNQPYLARAGLTEAEILVQQQQRPTSYIYQLQLGLNYSFGSAFNNVVFPRFTSGGVL